MWKLLNPDSYCSDNMPCPSQFCLCSECYTTRLKRKYSFMLDDQTPANLQENSSKDRKCIPKQNILDESKKHCSPLSAKKQWCQDSPQESDSTSEKNLNSSSSEDSDPRDEITKWSEKILGLIERQGIPDDLYPINVVSDVDLEKIPKVAPRSTLTETIERKVNVHLAKEFAKMGCIDRKRLQRKSNSSKHNAEALAKRKKLQRAKKRLDSENNRYGTIVDLNCYIDSDEKDLQRINDRLARKAEAEIYDRPNLSDPYECYPEECKPYWKRYLDNMKVPRSPPRKTLRSSLLSFEMEETEMKSAQLQVDSSGDETGYESEHQSPGNELSLFSEAVIYQARSNSIPFVEMNSSKSFRMVPITKKKVSLPNEERFQDVENAGSFINFDKKVDMKFGNNQLNSFQGHLPRAYEPVNTLNAMSDMLANLNTNSSVDFYSNLSGLQPADESSSNRSPINVVKPLKFPESSHSKVPDYSKPGCSKDADYMGSSSVNCYGHVEKTEKRSQKSANFRFMNVNRPYRQEM